VGIGDKGRLDMRDFVLSRFSDSDQELIDKAIEQAALAARCYITDGVQKAMADYNTRKEKPPKHKKPAAEAAEEIAFPAETTENDN
jgi:hypothetical protein